MPEFRFAERLETLPPYLFAEIDRVKNQAIAKGMDIINLGIGDPDKPTPDFIIESLYAASKKPVNHQYPSHTALLTFRTAVAEWYKRRFGVNLDPKTEVLSLIGSKEGLAHFPLAFVNPGDLVLTATPNYPVYPIATGFAGGRTHFVPLTEENDFLPDLDAIDADTWGQARMFFLNFPNNPTAAVAPREFFEKLIALARQHNVIIVHDAAYTEIYFDENNRPMSILELPGAKDVCIEFHSLSKTYNMTGWRIGMAVGNERLVAGLGKIKSNVDSGIFQAVQEAGITALTQGDAFAAEMRDMYRQRRDAVVSGLKKIGLACQNPKATFYVWAGVPAGHTSAEFAKKVIEEAGVVVTPGNGFGAPGEGYFRIALTVDVPRLEEAVSRIQKL